MLWLIDLEEQFDVYYVSRLSADCQQTVSRTTSLSRSISRRSRIECVCESACGQQCYEQVDHNSQVLSRLAAADCCPRLQGRKGGGWCALIVWWGLVCTDRLSQHRVVCVLLLSCQPLARWNIKCWRELYVKKRGNSEPVVKLSAVKQIILFFIDSTNQNL